MTDEKQNTDQVPDLSTEDVTADVTESDPNGNGPDGLAGEMGVSSERVGSFERVPGEATHAKGPANPDAPRDADDQALDTSPADPPEQSADPRTGEEVQPDNDLPPHQFDKDTWQGHSHG